MEAPATRRELNLYKTLLFEQIRVRIGDNFIPYADGLAKHPGQRHLHFDDWRYGVLVWGRRTGKTIGASAEITAELGLPDRRVWVVAPNYELTDKVFEYVYRWVVLEEIFGPGSVVKHSRSQNNRYIEMAWGSFVKGKSCESPDSMLGDQLDLIVFDESARASEMIWLEHLEPTTIDRKGRVLFISTPRGKNWFYDYYLRGQDPYLRAEGWMSSRFTTADNPYTDTDWLESKRAQTPELVWRREYEASFEDFGGRIYPEFKSKLLEHGGHLFDPTTNQAWLRQTSWPIYNGIDIGFRLPTAAIWAKVDESNNIWVFREYEEAGIIHEDHAENIKANSPDGIYQTYISPDAARRFGTGQSIDANSPIQIYRNHGIYARPANDDFDVGTGLVARYIRATLQHSTDHPKLFISTQCPKLIRCLEDYQYLDVKSRSDLDQPERPRKKDDHLPDALRYLVAANPRFLRDWRRTGTDRVVSPVDTRASRSFGRTKIAGL